MASTILNAVDIYRIGDLQGDYCTFIMCLKMAGVIDDNISTDTKIKTIQWIGNDKLIIQVGDFIAGGEKKDTDKIYENSGMTEEDYIKKREKCTQSHKIIKLVLRLNANAASKGKKGRIHLILGNGDIKGILLNDEMNEKQKKRGKIIKQTKRENNKRLH